MALSSIKNRDFGVYRSQSTGQHYEVVESIRMHSYSALKGGVQESEGSRSYATRCGLYLNPRGSSTESFVVVQNDDILTRI